MPRSSSVSDFSQFVCENLLLGWCFHCVRVRKCILDVPRLEVTLCTWSEEWCNLFRKLRVIKGSRSILFTHMTYMSLIVLQPQGHFIHGWTVEHLKWFWEGPKARSHWISYCCVWNVISSSCLLCIWEMWVGQLIQPRAGRFCSSAVTRTH